MVAWKSVFVFACIIAFAFAEGNVKVLTPENFDDEVGADKGVFIKFFAPWCGHCKALAPAYEEVADAFVKFNEAVTVAEVDCDSHKALCSRFGVSGYPTLKWFPQGSSTPEDYNGGRATEDILDFINKKGSVNARIFKAPSPVVVLDDSNFNDIVMDESKAVFVKFYAPWCGHCKALAPKWEELAQAFEREEDVIIAEYDADQHKTYGAKYEVTGFPTILFFGKGAEKKGEKYMGARETEALVEYTNENAGTARQVDGSLDAKAGVLEDFEDLVDEFKSTPSAAVVEKVKKLALTFTTDAEKRIGKFYSVFMDRQLKKATFVEDEIDRLTKMIASGQITGQKIDEFTIRLNILKLFQDEE